MAPLMPNDVQVLGDELAISWSDGGESYLKLDTLRRLCPCASCAGERDLLGRVAKPPSKPLTTASFRLVGTQLVGGYALQLTWADGHGDGLFTFDRLRAWGDAPPELPPLRVSPLLPTFNR